jgi:hypothetical protein
VTEASLARDVLSAGRKTPINELTVEPEYSQNHIYDVLDELVADGRVTEIRGSKNRRIVQITDHPVVESYRNLRSKLDRVDWPDILSPAILRVYWMNSL